MSKLNLKRKKPMATKVSQARWVPKNKLVKILGRVNDRQYDSVVLPLVGGIVFYALSILAFYTIL